MRDETERGQKLGLNEAELAFYDALAQSESAREVLGDVALREIAQELVQRVRENVTIDWTMKESARAKLRVLVKRLLRKYNYPPEKRNAATDTVLDQARVWSKE